MAGWYLAPSLVALRNEINSRWPNRDKASDGAVGDTSHQARKSDHNPDYSAGGVVRAVDVDKDGIDVDQLLDAVVRDPRAAYVIWNGRIASATDDGAPWDWEPYDGANAHTQHLHISIKHTRAAETDTSPWFTTQEEDYMATPEAKAQLDRIEKVLGTLAAAEAARYSDLAGRVEQVTAEERGRYQYYAGRFGEILTELQDDPASPVQR